jgi:hypothetical protein
MTTARRRDLHVPINTGRWADDALRSGEFFAQWCRTATAHRCGLAVGIRRACSPFLGEGFRVACASATCAGAKDAKATSRGPAEADLRSVLRNASRDVVAESARAGGVQMLLSLGNVATVFIATG